MEKYFVSILIILLIMGCEENGVVNENEDVPKEESEITLVVTPNKGDSISICDTIIVDFSSKVTANTDEYGNSSFTRYGGPIEMVVNPNHWSATFVPTTYVYDESTNKLKIYFVIHNDQIIPAGDTIMNMGLSIKPQGLIGENGRQVKVPSLNQNGAYLVQYEFYEKTTCDQ